MNKAEISPPSLADIDALAREALNLLPPDLRASMAASDQPTGP